MENYKKQYETLVEKKKGLDSKRGVLSFQRDQILAKKALLEKSLTEAGIDINNIESEKKRLEDEMSESLIRFNTDLSLFEQKIKEACEKANITI